MELVAILTKEQRHLKVLVNNFVSSAIFITVLEFLLFYFRIPLAKSTAYRKDFSVSLVLTSIHLRLLLPQQLAECKLEFDKFDSQAQYTCGLVSQQEAARFR